MADKERAPAGTSEVSDNKGRNTLLIAAHALGLFMAITGGFITLIAALLGIIEWMSEEAAGYDVTGVVVWFAMGAALVLLGRFLAQIKDPSAPVERPDSWASR